MNKYEKYNQKIFIDNIENLTKSNDNYRKVIYTTPNNNFQLVLMSLKPNEEIGLEVHNDINQFFRVEFGSGIVQYNNVKKEIKNGDVVIIPAGTYHNIINNGKTELKLYTIYNPANHPRDKIEKNKLY